MPQPATEEGGGEILRFAGRQVQKSENRFQNEARDAQRPGQRLMGAAQDPAAALVSGSRRRLPPAFPAAKTPGTARAAG